MDLAALNCLYFNRSIENALKQSKLPHQSGYFVLCNDNKPLLVDKCYNLAEDILHAWQKRLHSQRLHSLWETANCIYFKETANAFEAIQLADVLNASLGKDTLNTVSLQPCSKRSFGSMLNDRKRKMHYTIRTDTFTWNQNVFQPPQIVRFTPDLLSKENTLFIGLFSSTSAAKKYVLHLIKEHRLCMKLMGFESSKNKFCFARKLHQCHGACHGAESLDSFTSRFLIAVKDQTLPSWPSKKIVVHRNPISNVYELYAYWSYLGAFDQYPTTSQISNALTDYNQWNVEEMQYMYTYWTKHVDSMFTSTL